jgi:hypothetical protein
LIWRLKLNPRATLTTCLAEGPALKAKNLKEVEHQTSCLNIRLVFGCGIGHSQNRIGQGVIAQAAFLRTLGFPLFNAAIKGSTAG